MPAPIETYKSLQDRVLSWMSDQGNTGLMLTLVKDAIKDSHERRLTAEPWTFMRWPRIETFTLVPGQQAYTLHELWLFPRYLQNRRTNQPLVEVSDRNFLANYDTDTGYNYNDGSQFVYSGRVKVQNQPLAATAITAASSDSGDNGNTVIVTGITASGAVISETLSLTISGSVGFARALDIVKVGTNWAGTLTVTAPGVTLLELGPAEFGKSYQQIELLEPPTSADVIEYSFYRQPKPLLLDNDTLDIPPPFTHLCVYDALLDLTGYTRATEAEVKRWRQKSADLELAMQQTFLEGHTLGAESPGITYVPR